MGALKLTVLPEMEYWAPEINVLVPPVVVRRIVTWVGSCGVLDKFSDVVGFALETVKESVTVDPGLKMTSLALKLTIPPKVAFKVSIFSNSRPENGLLVAKLRLNVAETVPVIEFLLSPGKSFSPFKVA